VASIFLWLVFISASRRSIICSLFICWQ
jgi:hypothetical protein